MRAVIINQFGGPENLTIGEHPTPQPAANEILIKVHATALNRADLLQREGKYPPPPGVSEILGLEIAGEITAIGTDITKWQVGDRVCGLLAGGGYAEYAVLHEEMALPIPDNLTFEEGAAIPEAFLTVFQTLVWLAKLQKGESILIHAGASGVGTAAIQLAKLFDARIFVTASKIKHEFCLQLGAHHAIDYKEVDFETEIAQQTDKQGVNVILDFIGAPYFQKNLNILQTDGRLIVLANMGGVNINDLEIGGILRKRLQIIGSTLRARPLEYKIALTKDFRLFAWEAFEKGDLKPIIDSVYDWNEVAEAHRYMESNENKGK